MFQVKILEVQKSRKDESLSQTYLDEKKVVKDAADALVEDLTKQVAGIKSDLEDALQKVRYMGA